MIDEATPSSHPIGRRQALLRIGTAAAGLLAGPVLSGPGAGAASAAPTTGVAGGVGRHAGIGGAFVIGDREAAVGQRVTFWGARWAAENALSGGPAPAAFKGYADVLEAPRPQCGQSWSTGPGGSCAPPARLASSIVVMVASRVTKSGQAVAGDVVSLA